MSDPAAARVRTGEAFLIMGWIGVFTTLLILDIDAPDDKRTPAGCAAAFVSAFAHGLWITLDARALNQSVRWWRFAAFFLGPLAIWTWLVVQYRIKSLVLIPVSIAVYLVPFALVMAGFMTGLIPEP